ncbi:MAG: hypothetical protein HOP34_16165 [Methylococcaceae bacterium]|nr:hypothetical protein [Methylococcaceae bacterium]
MDALVVLIPLLPFTAAVVLGVSQLFGILKGEASENTTALLAMWALCMASLLALVLAGADALGYNHGVLTLGSWLDSEGFAISANFTTTGLPVRLAALFALLLVIVMRFAINYLHREAGFHRFFFLLSLFAAGMLLLVLSGNAVGSFFGWEIAGLCSYGLIAYAYNRPVAASNATRVFITNRIGDTGFILGIALSAIFADSLNWQQINTADLTTGQATGIALSFSVAAFAKSAQLPFTPWLARAMEGPTPSSAVFYGAVMVHAGVFLVCVLAPVFEQAPLAMAVLVIVGGLTALYSFIVGLTQTDVKSALSFATTGQLGLMFLACGLGFWQWASWHVCAHAVVRGYLMLTAPSLMHNVLDNPIKPIHPKIASLRWAYIASLQRFWLDPFTDWTLIRPIRRLAHDLSYFDDHVIDPFMGATAPMLSRLSSYAQLEEHLVGAQLNDENLFAKGTGLAGKLTEWTAALMHWFEDRFVLRGIGKDALHFGRKLGHVANQFEQLILRPRYLVLFVFITLLVAF